MRTAPALLTAFAVLAASCAPRAWRFRDQPPVTRVLDDAPIGLPAIRVDPVDVVAVSDAFVRRPVAQALTPGRIPRAGDVNSIDEVVLSSWFGARADDPEPEGPPQPPLVVLIERTPTGERGLAVRDRRGKRYELRRDTTDRPEMRTGADAVTSRIARAIGYFVPEVHVAVVREDDFRLRFQRPGADSIPDPGSPDEARYPEVARKALEAFLAEAPTSGGAVRVAAVRWPVGVDVGRTPDVGVRDDDPNDLVPHEDRRTLRAIKVLSAWIGQTRFLPQAARDLYVGEPGRGHLRHVLTRFDGTFGGDAVVRDEPEQKDELKLLLTLGFAPPPDVPPSQKRFTSVGDFGPAVDLSRVGPGIPFTPMDRFTPADAYWMATRMAAISTPTLERAVEAGRYSDPAAARWLVRTLKERRRTLLDQIFKLATPASLEGVGKDVVYLRDLAVHHGLVVGGRQDYLAAVLGEDGERVGGSFHLRPDDEGRFRVRFTAETLRRPYLVLRLQVLREGLSTAPVQVHLRTDGPWGLRVVGVLR